ncbi:MAG: FecR family protein [Elusimicrobiaceae bacterium]
MRTGFRSQAMIFWKDGTKVELAANSSYRIEKDDADTSVGMKLFSGKLKATVNKMLGRKFEVSTPNAVCAVRGTVFEVEVRSNFTNVSLYQGQLAVSDQQGNQRLLEQGYSMGVGANGLGAPRGINQNAPRDTGAINNLKREVGLNMSKEAVLSAAAEEIKVAEYQQGKVMVDVSGARVRLEQYIMRPADNQFKLVTLNERNDRLDYFYYLGSFNKTLPADMSIALGQMTGCAGSACEYFMTGYETGRSNTIDSVHELASGGHMVDVNNNSDSADDVASYFDSNMNAYLPLGSGDSFYKTFYDNYAIKYNDVTFLNWAPVSGSNVQSYLVGDASGINYRYIQNDGTLGAFNTGSPGVNSDKNPDGDLIHEKIKLTYGTGKYWEQYDNYLVNDKGKIATLSDFEGFRPGTAAGNQTMLQWNFEQVITCNLFEGRKIDLVIEPKTLIQSGLLK